MRVYEFIITEAIKRLSDQMGSFTYYTK